MQYLDTVVRRIMPRTSWTQGTYADLEIRILARQPEGYPVEITFSGEQEFPRGYLTPEIVLWRSSLSTEEDGERLFDLLFADDHLKSAWAEVHGQCPRRRIRLRLDASVPELHVIPWELLRYASPGISPHTLAADVATPFSRYLAGQWRPGSPVLSRPIKLLVAIANPANLGDYQLAALDIEAEQQALTTALTSAGVAGEQLNLTFLPQPVTLSALEAELKQGHHILHVIAHGIFHKEQERAFLFLANADNQVLRVSDAECAEMLARQGMALRLVFLASCQTATRSSADAFRGFAPTLVAAGVPAVFAMQDLVPIDTARAFASTFYRQLVQHGQVDVASNEARSAVLTARLPGAALPVLFMRLRSGALFGERGQILGERVDSFWDILLDNIAEGACTPFLGPGVTHGLLPTHEEIAHLLADNYHYPFMDNDRLPRVAQFIATLDNRRLRRDIVRLCATAFRRSIGQKPRPDDRTIELSAIIEAAHWSALSREINESEIHHQLADLALPLYITTNFDNFMTLALKAKGRTPRRETIAWREALKTGAASPHYDLEPPATAAAPVVLHLYGTDEDLLSLVLTEDDYLDYLARLARDHEYLLPTSVNAALASTTLLFLGYRLEDLDLKVIMRGLLTHLDLERWGMLHVAVQVEAAHVDEAQQKEVSRYFQKYFGDSRIDVYWGSTHQFVADLHTRWQSSHEEQRYG
jgi:hypothetical protein